MKFTLPLVVILQAGAPATAVKRVTPCFTFGVYKCLDTSLYVIIASFHMELEPQVKVSHSMNYPAFTLCTTFDYHVQLVNLTHLITFD